MTIEIALLMVALVLIAFAASRVMRRERPTATRQEATPTPPRSPFRKPHYEPRRPAHFAPPPVTIETLPIDFKRVAAEMVPPIDHAVLAALAACGSRTAAGTPRPEMLARGSIPAGFAASDDASDLDAALNSDVDDAETLRPAEDLDADSLTRTNMSRVH